MTDLAGARFADLYAGSGAVGLEAALPGRRPRAAGRVRSAGRPGDPRQHRHAGRGRRARVVTGTVAQGACRGPPDGEPYDVVFADPPYAVTEPTSWSRCSRRWWTPAGWRRTRCWSSSAHAAPRDELGGRRHSRPRARRYGETTFGTVGDHEACGLSRLVRPGHQRPSGHHRPGQPALRRGHHRRADQPAQDRAVHRRGADRDAPRGDQAVPERAGRRRSAGCWSTSAGRRTPRSWSRASVRSATSTTSCRWRR